MTFALPSRVGLLSLLCALPLGCSDDGAGGTTNPSATAGSSGAAMAGNGSGTGGSSAGMSTTGGAAGSGAMAGSSGSGGDVGGAGGGGGGGGSGGAAIDPNGGAPAGPAKTRHTARPVGTFMNNTAGYWEYVPPHYGNGALYPLLVFRHGVGENGSGDIEELKKVVVHGPPKLIEANEWPEERPFVVLSVQHPGGGCPTAQEMDDFFQFALDNYDIDPKRVYLTGLSCGAIGSWNYLSEHVDEGLLAAVVPIAGDVRGAYEKQMCDLNKVPIWAFHGDADMSVTIEKAQVPIESLMGCTDPPPTNLKLTIYPGVDHVGSWTMAYSLSNPNDDIYAWMLSHSKP